MEGLGGIWRYLLTVVVAVVLGALTGVVIGGANSDPFDTVIKTVARESRTVTATETETVTKTKTETVTEAEPDLPEPGAPGGSDADDTDTDGCSDSYAGACVAPADGYGTATCLEVDEEDFSSLGDDPHGLDPDGDGIACERR